VNENDAAPGALGNRPNGDLVDQSSTEQVGIEEDEMPRVVQPFATNRVCRAETCLFNRGWDGLERLSLGKSERFQPVTNDLDHISIAAVFKVEANE
jgi:hypothetical protein